MKASWFLFAALLVMALLSMLTPWRQIADLLELDRELALAVLVELR